jgi:hypothetical protein
MEYLVEFNTTIPDDAPPAEVEQRLAGETTRVAELAAQGHACASGSRCPRTGAGGPSACTGRPPTRSSRRSLSRCRCVSGWRSQ